QEDAGRRCVAERGVVVLGQVIAVEAGLVVSLDELQPLLEMAGQRLAAVVEMIEHAELHPVSPWLAPPHPPSAAPRTPSPRKRGEGFAAAPLGLPLPACGERVGVRGITPPTASCR